jgi:hypothetical protein
MGGEQEHADELMRKHPEWRIWRHGMTTYARWLKASPPIVLTGTTFEEFSDRIPKAEAARDAGYWEILKAAGERKR